MTAEVYRAAGKVMAERGLAAGVADEGGWWPAFSSNEQALDTLMRAIERAGLSRARRSRSRSTSPPRNSAGADATGSPREARTGPRRARRAAARLGSSLSDPVDRRPFRRGRRRGHAALHGGGRRAGPDHRRRFLVTNARRSSRRRAKEAANAVLIKLNQAGTVTRRKGGARSGPAPWLRHDRLGPLGRNRGRLDRPSRRRLGRRTAEGRLLRALRADGEVERGLAHRGSARREGAFCRAGRPAGGQAQGVGGERDGARRCGAGLRPSARPRSL